MKCPYCGSENIKCGIKWAKEVDSGKVGLKYISSGGRIISTVGVAEAYSDLCLDCKTIVRTYIKEDTNKKWCE